MFNGGGPMNANDFEAYFKSKAADAEKVYQTQLREGINCKHCFDTGFSWMDCDTKNLWCFCKCKEGAVKEKTSKFKLPRVDYEMLRFFQYKDFPIIAFLPKFQDRGNIVDVANMIKNRFEQSLKKSEKEWSLG